MVKEGKKVLMLASEVGLAQSRDAADLLFSSSSARKRHFRLSEVGAPLGLFFCLVFRFPKNGRAGLSFNRSKGCLGAESLLVIFR